MESIRSNRGMAFGILGSVLASAIILYCGAWSYSQYRRELIKTEQEQLLAMARTVGTSLVNFVEQELDNLELYFTSLELQGQDREAGGIRQAAEVFFESGDGLYDAVACYGPDGGLVFQLGPMDYGYRWAAGGKRAAICGKRLVGDHYEMFISKKFVWGGELYTVIYAMDLNEIYVRIVEPVKIGEGGYSIVKDKDLSIIMHHAPGQIGMDAVYDRGKRYPQLDLTDLSRWIQAQQVEPEGVDVINSYLWDDPGLAEEKRIVAYTSIRLPGETWIVNSTLPFRELDGPLNRMFLRLMGISGVYLAAVAIFVFVMTRSFVRTEGQKREIDYLRQINDGMELLCRKEEEIQHYQRVQSIGQMSSHIAHEFNNYLTPVMLYGEILEGDGSIGEENRELVKGILNAAAQAADLSRKLLDFGRQDSGSVLSPINLTEEVQAAVNMVRQLTPQEIEFSSEIDGQDIYVMGKAGMAEHILMNLSNNAYHAMEGSGGRLTVRFGRTPGAAEAELSVSDTGCGIGPDKVDKIFEPFFTTKRSGKGTGLGLSVIRNLMVSVGGRIQVESAPGEGATFWLYFPEVKAPEADGSGGKAAKCGRVAVVDDEPEMLKALEAALKRKNRKAECFTHPAVVLSRLQKHRDYFDLIITDYSMPSMDGLEFAAVVRRLNPDIRLVLMSGKEEEQFSWYLKNRFIDAFILKSDLAKKLDSVL